MTATDDESLEQTGDGRLSLSTTAARNLATTTKSAPQMQGITSRWLLRQLPWVNVSGGTYRVNRRLKLVRGRGRVAFSINSGEDVQIIPETLAEIPILRGYGDSPDEREVLATLASRFTTRQVAAGETIAEAGSPITEAHIIAHGKVEKIGTGRYGNQGRVAMLADGDHMGDEALDQGTDPLWNHSYRTTTSATILTMPWSDFQMMLATTPSLQRHVAAYLRVREAGVNTKGEAEIKLTSGHEGEPVIDGTFVDYDLSPREYELSLAQTILRVHTRVADLYNDPMNQFEQQLKLTVEEMRERQEWELLNNRDFGLLYNTDYDQRISTHSGPPTPDDMDDLIAMRRGTNLLLAHPKAIAAFLRECNKRGLTPGRTVVQGKDGPSEAIAWRGVPLLPSGHIPINGGGHISTIVAARLGEDDQGVIGLTQTGIPDEYEPGLNVRFMGISDQAIMKYLVSAYYSVAILVPDAIGLLENVEIAAPRS